MMGLTNQLVMAAAGRRGWQVKLIDESSNLIRYTDSNGTVHYCQTVLTSATNAWQLLVAKNKDLLYKLAEAWDWPVPATAAYENPEQARDFLQKHALIVVKPKDGAHGRGVTTNVDTAEKLQAAIEIAQPATDQVLLQEHLVGDDYRLLFIGGEYKAAAIREPASVRGDGEHTIRQLITLENQRPERGENYQTRLNRINLDAAEQFLGPELDSVPGSGDMVRVVGPANIGLGGAAHTVTRAVPGPVHELASAVMARLKLGLCGVDIIYSPAAGPALIELNTNPSFGLHMLPQAGDPEPVDEYFLDWLERSVDQD
jgi:cyanophycin synthetase